MGEELVFTAVAGDGEFGEAEDGDVGLAGFFEAGEDAFAITDPVHGGLVEAAGSDSDHISHGGMITRLG